MMPQLARYRRRRGWSQEALARKLRELAKSQGDPEPAVDGNMISRWERGVRNPTPRYAGLLARLFSVRVDALGFGTDSAHKPLTQREWEVAGLVAAGSTNRQVAEQLSISVRTVELHVSHVLAELGFSSRRALAAWVRDRHDPRGAADPAERSKSGVGIYKWPAQRTNFIGRERELAELERMLRESSLVTIAGASGLGKTRLAIELALRLRAKYTEGVWFSGLAALTDPALVPAEVANALEVHGSVSGSIPHALSSHIGDRKVLLVLDNCEHVLDACARLVEDLLRDCPGLRVVATSHQSLGVPGERVWRIGSLGLPDPEGHGSPFGAEAVRLFQDRAALVQPRFAVNVDNVGTVSLICRRLDGNPLAIELAASRLETMSADDILVRLEDRFRLLTSRSRTALPRHQALRASLDWGHHLLNDDERRLFRRLSVIAGEFELAAAEFVGCGPDLALQTVFAHLSGLVDKSLLVSASRRDGRTWFRMLETVRRYAAERLVEADESDDAHHRYAHYLLAMAEEGAGADRWPGRAPWLERLEAAHDGLRVAIEWCRVHDRGRWVRLVLALAPFWLVRGHLGEGRESLETVIASPSLAPADRACAHYWLSRAAFYQGDYVIAREHGDTAVAAYRTLKDDLGTNWALNLLGSIHLYSGNLLEAMTCLEEVLSRSADVATRVETLTTIGELRLVGGDVAGARSVLDQALTESSGAERGFHPANGAFYLAVADYFDREYQRASDRLNEVLDIFQQLGDRYGLSGAFNLAGALAVSAGAPEQGLRLCGAATAMRETIGAQLAPGWRDLVRAVVVEPARDLIGSKRAEAALAAGTRMSMNDAVAQAKLFAKPAGAEEEGQDPLSRRERDVAELVALGMTNRQVAHRLGIAERTVEGHLDRIRAKLGLNTRTQIAVWVVARQ